MIKSATYPKTVDGEHCQKLAADMQDGATFIKKNRITLFVYNVVYECLRELWHYAETKTCISEAANIFGKYGFTVSMDEDGINYRIA
jgi:hypothetical protein